LEVVPTACPIATSLAFTVTPVPAPTAISLVDAIVPPPVKPAPAVILTDVWSMCSFATKFVVELFELNLIIRYFLIQILRL